MSFWQTVGAIFIAIMAYDIFSSILDAFWDKLQ